MKGLFLWILLLLPTHTSHSSHSPDFPKVCQHFPRAQCCVWAVSLPSQQPWERGGASPGSALVLRRDLMCLPAKVWPLAQPVHEALAAGLCRSLLGFLKGKTCQLWEGGQHNDGNKA